MGFDNIHTATDKLTAANSAPTITELKNITQAELTKISTQANAEKTLINAKIAVAKDIIENHTKYSLEDTQSAEMELGSAQAFLNVITTFENALSTYKKNHQAEVAATKHTASTATNALSLTLDEEIQVALEPINKFVKDANAIKTESYATYEPKNTTEPNASKIQVAVNNQASKSARVAHRPVTKKILNAGSAVATTPKQAEVKLVEVTKSANEIKFEENNKKYQELLQEQVLQGRKFTKKTELNDALFAANAARTAVEQEAKQKAQASAAENTAESSRINAQTSAKQSEIEAANFPELHRHKELVKKYEQVLADLRANPYKGPNWNEGHTYNEKIRIGGQNLQTAQKLVKNDNEIATYETGLKINPTSSAYMNSSFDNRKEKIAELTNKNKELMANLEATDSKVKLAATKVEVKKT